MSDPRHSCAQVLPSLMAAISGTLSDTSKGASGGEDGVVRPGLAKDAMDQAGGGHGRLVRASSNGAGCMAEL